MILDESLKPTAYNTGQHRGLYLENMAGSGFWGFNCCRARGSLAAIVCEFAEVLPQIAAFKSVPVFLSGDRSRALAGRAAVRSGMSGSRLDDLVAQARSTIEAARKVCLVKA